MFLPGFTTVGPTSRMLLMDLLANFNFNLLHINSVFKGFQGLSYLQFFFQKAFTQEKLKNNYINRVVGYDQKAKEVYKKTCKCNVCNVKTVSGSTVHA